MKYSYKTSGVCAKRIDLDIENGIVKNIEFVGGCAGNTSGISALCKDMPIKDIIEKVKGIKCGFKSSSCPDQLSLALEEALQNESVAQ